MQIELDLQLSVSKALQAVFSIQAAPETVLLQPTRKEFEGDFTLVCFPYTKQAGKSPEQVAQALGEYLTAQSAVIKRFNVVKGFLNLLLDDQVWLHHYAQIGQNSNFGQLPANGQKVMVEFSSPNTNKPLHLGHMRNIFIGNALSNILKAAGYEVIKANLINDRGIHICKSMLAYQKAGVETDPLQSGQKGDHLVGHYYIEFDKQYKEEIKELIAQGQTEEQVKKLAPSMVEAQELLLKWEQNDPETVALWKKMNSWVYEGFNASYQRMKVEFDKYYYESDTYLLGKDLIEEGLEQGAFYKKEDGSVWIDLSEDGLDQKLLLRSDGTSVYITQDLGTADLKYKDFGINKSIYVVGDEQNYHFQVLFKILEKLGRPYAPGLYHLSYGMVDLPSGKMKSREGTVVDADALMDEMVETARERTLELGKIEGFSESELNQLFEVLGLGAIKYFLLKVDPKKRMLFNPAESIDMQGNTATAVQYCFARIQSIKRKAAESGIMPLFQINLLLEPAEKNLLVQMARFEDVLKEAAENYSPALLANYLYDLVRDYNQFFAELSIFKAETNDSIAFRAGLSGLVGQIIGECGKLLGIGMPERM